jgi:predicted RNA binding protein YcfA (HicA-like mRNA interferase family)
MKKRDLVKILKKEGCEMIRHGRKHDIYHNPRTSKTEPVPRHNEINEKLAKKIIKSLSTER